MIRNTIRNAAQRRATGVEHFGQEEEEEERAEQQNSERQDEEDAALQALLDLTGDLGLGEFDLGADKVSKPERSRPGPDAPMLASPRRAGVHLGQRNGRDRLRHSISGEALALSVGHAHLSTSPGCSLASVAMAAGARPTHAVHVATAALIRSAMPSTMSRELRPSLSRPRCHRRPRPMRGLLQAG